MAAWPLLSNAVNAQFDCHFISLQSTESVRLLDCHLFFHCHLFTGKTSSLISISEALVPVIYSPVYSKVYMATMTTFTGAFYLISVALAIPAIGILT